MIPQQSLSRPSTRSWSHGFSLVELSIVLVILGLLTGGILAGQDLIRSAELRAVTTEFQEYQAAVQTFRNKYMALPGDMDNATRFWGAADTSGSDGGCGDPSNDLGSGTETCNGNGDGMIAYGTAEYNEGLRFWQHLANAGLLAGSYTGVTGPDAATLGHVVGQNSPASGLSNNTGWGIVSWDDASGYSQLFDGAYGTNILLGKDNNGQRPTSAALTPTELWRLDTKLDDGMPATGSVVPRQRDSCTDATSAITDSDNFDARYSLDRDSIVCTLLIRNLFGS